ncbi:UNKNOWN [Stylonychia lemnae]|uniref:Wntless-like transmembrane domain-containing protein n=1 Tax=Stylonychia lemnae TaxID=5949 RepID=A0A078A0S0_STYLE|nr:UNKNOWN [Stylonychia lemnae]|eukprot:CDW75735.1 UNKNOWN [Stylonychia lemnae]
MQTTENPQLSQQCNAPLSQDSLAVLKKPQDKLTWNPVINNHLKNRTLNSQGDYDEIMQNNFIYVNTNANQEIYQVQEITFFLKMRNLDHTKSLTQMKYFFVIVGLFTLFYYYRAISHFQMDDLGLIQKWVFVLLVQLLFFDDPFYAARNIFPYSSYSIIQALCQATFLSMILFFWLVNEVINIDERRFYLPKVVLCLCIWVVMMLSSGYLNLQQISDPSFYWRDDIGSFYSTMQILTVILFFLYFTYFVIVAYVAFFQIKEMKKSYKFTVMYVSFYSLMNIYMFIIAYLYSPSVDSLEDLQFKQTRKEHEHIMNQFYEQELPDISKEMDSSREVLNKDRKKSKNGVEKRRYMKKDPEQKAKDVSELNYLQISEIMGEYHQGNRR